MRTILTALVLTLVGFVLHEGAHGFAGVLLGYEMELTINRATPIGGYSERAHMLLIAIAGPLATLAIAFLAATFARISGSMTAFILTFTCLLQRLTAQAVSFANPNDEMKVSAELGLGSLTIPIAVVVLLVFFTAWAARGAKPSIWQWLLAYAGTTVGITAVVFGESYLPAITW